MHPIVVIQAYRQALKDEAILFKGIIAIKIDMKDASAGRNVIQSSVDKKGESPTNTCMKEDDVNGLDTEGLPRAAPSSRSRGQSCYRENSPRRPSLRSSGLSPGAGGSRS